MHVSLTTFAETEHKEFLYMKVWGPRAFMFTQPLKSKVNIRNDFSSIRLWLQVANVKTLMLCFSGQSTLGNCGKAPVKRDVEDKGTKTETDQSMMTN